MGHPSQLVGMALCRRKIEMGSATKHQVWARVIFDLIAIGFDHPVDLSKIHLRALANVLIENERTGLALQLWQSCVLVYTSISEGGMGGGIFLSSGARLMTR